MIILGIDPGASGALALVKMASRPKVLGSWSVYSESLALWSARAMAALNAAQRLTLQIDRIAIEIPGGGGRSRRGTRGPGAMLGLGRNTGRIEGLCWAMLPQVEVVEIDSGAWPRAMSCPVGKCGLGWHRVIEARTLLDLPEGWPRGSIPVGMQKETAKRWVALAEAALIAAAVGRQAP